MNDSHDNGAAGRLSAYLAEREIQISRDEIAALAVNANQTVWLRASDLRAVLAENETMRQQLRLVAEELEEFPEMCHWLTGPRCGEAYDRAREARRLVGQWQPADPPPLEAP